MPLPAPLPLVLTEAGLSVEEDEPLDRRVYWRVGGPADALVKARTVSEVSRLRRILAEYPDVPLTVLGKGSNVLVSDKGVRGVVLVLLGELAEAEAVAPDWIVAGAGLPLVALLARAKTKGWSGLEWAAGIPGTVGGAVCMNAGSSLGEAGGGLVSVRVSLPDGSEAEIPASELGLAYRTCRLPPGAVVLSATFRLTGEDPEASQERVRAFLERRKATQPLNRPSCGSTFRNPPGDAAGRLIEACGLKGFRVGGAEVSEKHANFIVTEEGATASDVRAVIAHVRAVVLREKGIDLEPEVLTLGDP